MVTSCLIKKVPNKAGNYSCQYVENGKVRVCSFRSYEDGVSYAFFEWNLTKERHLQNSVIMELDK